MPIYYLKFTLKFELFTVYHPVANPLKIALLGPAIRQPFFIWESGESGDMHM